MGIYLGPVGPAPGTTIALLDLAGNFADFEVDSILSVRSEIIDEIDCSIVIFKDGSDFKSFFPVDLINALIAKTVPQGLRE